MKRTQKRKKKHKIYEGIKKLVIYQHLTGNTIGYQHIRKKTMQQKTMQEANDKSSIRNE